MPGNIYLIGFPGAGKTTVGRQLAKLLHRDFIDVDRLIEERTGVSINHIFEIEGEAGFRKRESQILEQVSRSDRAVISTGGGIVLSEKNRKIMCEYGRVIYLKASMGILWQRLKGCQNRPLLQSADSKGKIAELLDEREPLYNLQADMVVEVTSDSAAAVARKIFRLMRNS